MKFEKSENSLRNSSFNVVQIGTWLRKCTIIAAIQDDSKLYEKVYLVYSNEIFLYFVKSFKTFYDDSFLLKILLS